MYDGTDVAFVVGCLLSAGLGGVCLIAAMIALGLLVVRKMRNETATPSSAGKFAMPFFISAVLCGISVPSGFIVYGVFEHQRGFANPPSHVLAVALASVWGPVVVSVFGVFLLWRRTVAGKPRLP